MKRLITALIILGSVHALHASSAEGAQAGWGWLETLGRWVNLLILGGVLYHFAKAPLRDFLQNRNNEIRQGMAEAGAANHEAEAQLAEVEKRLEDLDAELARIREEAEQEAQVERNRLLREAERDGEKILATARREVDGLVRNAQKELREYAANLSVQLAEEQIRREMTEEAQERILERFLVTLGKRGVSQA